MVLKIDAIEGIGDAYAEKLRTRNAESRAAKMAEVNGEKKLCKADPSSSQVPDWIDQADKLPPMVET